MLLGKDDNLGECEDKQFKNSTKIKMSSEAFTSHR